MLKIKNHIILNIHRLHVYQTLKTVYMYGFISRRYFYILSSRVVFQEGTVKGPLGREMESLCKKKTKDWVSNQNKQELKVYLSEYVMRKENTSYT